MNLGMDREYLVKGFDDANVQAYYNYQVDTAVIFGAERFTAELEMKDILTFEMQLAEVKMLSRKHKHFIVYIILFILDFDSKRRTT